MVTSGTADVSWSPPWTIAAVLAAMVVGAVAATPQLGVPLVAGVAGVVVLGLIVWRVELGVYALLLVTYLNFSDIAIERFGAPSLTKTLMAVVFATLAFRWLTAGERPAGDRGLVLALVAFAMASYASLFGATNVESGTDALSTLVKDALITLTVVAIVTDQRMLRPAVWMVILAGLILGAIGSYQYLTGSFDQEFLGLGRARVQQIVGEIDSYRLIGPLDDPNTFAHILIPVLPLAWERMRGEPGPLLRLLAAASLACSALGLVFTYSRSGVVALLATVMFCWWTWHRRDWRLPLVACVIALVALPNLPANYVARLSQTFDLLDASGRKASSDHAISGRLGEMQVAVGMFLDHPISGVGIGNYPHRFLQYNLQLGLRPRGEERKAHSLYLEIAAERGLLGLGAFALLLGLAAERTVRARRWLTRTGQVEQRRILEALALAIGGYLIMSAFLHEAYARYFWILLGLLLAAARIGLRGAGDDPEPAATIPEVRR